jgi:sugar phosphate isomerase/epimerase
MPLRCYMNYLALDNLGPFPEGPVAAIKQAGYDGIQFIDPINQPALTEARTLNLGVCGSGRVNIPTEADPIAQSGADNGLECLTLHAGWGLEDDTEGAHLIESILTASQRHRIPLYVETHRATLFQDMQRTIKFIERFPELTFNADFSHWYTGSEMVYGGFDRKLAFIQPVLDRVRFIHGRIGNPGCMQVDIGDGDPETHPFVAHFRTLWTKSFEAYLRTPNPAQPFITFTPELLAPSIYYARTFQGAEESDRWQQSLLLTTIGRECFTIAEESTKL